MLKEIRPAIVFVVALTDHHRSHLSVRDDRHRRGHFPLSGARKHHRTGRQGGRIGADRAGIHQRPIFPRPSVRDGCARPERFDQDRSRALQRGEFRRLEPGSHQQGPDRTGAGRCRQAQAGEPVGSGPDRSGDHDRQRPRPGHLAGGRAFPGAACCESPQHARRSRTSACQRANRGTYPRLSRASRG